MTNQVIIRCLSCRANKTFGPTVLLWTVEEVASELTHKMDCYGQTLAIEMGESATEG